MKFKKSGHQCISTESQAVSLSSEIKSLMAVIILKGLATELLPQVRKETDHFPFFSP